MPFIKNPEKLEKRKFVLCDKEVVVRDDNLELSEEDLKSLSIKESFTDTDFGYSALVIENESLEKLPAGLNHIQLREYFWAHSYEENMLIARAKSISEWFRANRFCGKCGTKLELDQTFSAQKCPSCKNQLFPRIEPCVIVLVHKDDEILLVKHVQRNQNMYVCIAGFIEAGESVEHAVYREVREETGIKVKNIRYKGSQSWPFPDQLMLAYYADYESGEIKVQESEILEAKWFKKSEAPEDAPRGSVAHRLIHDLFNEGSFN